MEFAFDNPREIHFELGPPPEGRLFLVTTRSVNAALGARIEEWLGPRLVGRFAAIRQHAPLADVRAAAAEAARSSPEALVSVGGGSAIDAAKCVAWMLATGIDPADAKHGEPPTLPHYAVPTTLSAAEMDGAAGFSDEGEKRGLYGRTLIPTRVLYDSELVLSTPLPLWLSTGIRAVDHAVEGFLAPEANPLSEAAALEALRRLLRALVRTHEAPDDRDARREAQIGAWLSMLLPLASSRGLSHTLGKRIGARHGIPHGVCSCLLLPHVMRDHQRRHPEKLAQLAGVLGGNPADRVADLIARLELPRHLGEFHLGDEDLRRAAEPVARRLHRPIEELVALYRAAW